MNTYHLHQGEGLMIPSTGGGLRTYKFPFRVFFDVRARETCRHFYVKCSNIKEQMEKVMTLGNGLMLQIAVLCDSIKVWLNGKSEYFTAILNEGEEDYEEVSRLQVIGINLGMLAALVLIGIVGSIENM